MTTEATPAPAAPRRGRRKKEEKKSLWQMDMGSLGKKKDGDDDDVVEHAPFVSTLPHVNLLPTDVTDAISIARVRKIFVVAVALLAVVVGGLWWLQGSTIAKAESDLAAATAQNAQLRSNLEALAPVKQMYEQITRLQTLVTTTLASQPQAAVVLDALATDAAANGGGITFTDASVNYTGIPAPGGDLNACPSPDPFGTEVTIGCLNFTATAQSREQVSALLRELEADPLFIGPYVTSTTATQVETGAKGKGTGTVVSFSGSAGVSLDALQTKLTQEQIDALVAPPAPAPAASTPAEGGEG